MRRFTQLLTLLALLAPPAASAAPQLIATFEDPQGDATGPGSYTPPGDIEFTDGDFDLRRFAVYADGGDVLFEVTLGAPFRGPAITQRTNQSELQLWNNIYLQNIDIYVDTRSPGAPSFTDCIPGRRVAFAPGRAWNAAVVLTPQPGPARNITEDALGTMTSSHIVFAERLEVHGRTVLARIPSAVFGGPPRRDWGYSVQVSGAAWERSFALLDRVTGRHEADAFTMPVLVAPEAWAFGGAPEGHAFPRVVDVLLPPGVSQRTVLGAYNSETGAYARVPFVYADGPPPLHASAAEPAAATHSNAPGAATSGAPGAPAAASGAANSDAPAATHSATPDGGTPAAPGATHSATPPPPNTGLRPLQLQLSPSNVPPPRVREGPELVVAFIAGNMISLRGIPGPLKPLQFGRVIGSSGAVVAHVVIVQVVETGLVVNAVDGESHIVPGLKVRFDAP